MEILFETMHRLGMHETFIKWTKMLFGNARTFVNLNGSPSKKFKVERGGQAIPWHPTLDLFLIKGEALNHTLRRQ